MNSKYYTDSFQDDNPEQTRRELNSGEFNPSHHKTHYRLYGAADVPKRTVQDIGVENNRKKPVEPYSPQSPVRNPITVGDFSKNINRDTLWQEDRRQRDNGR